MAFPCALISLINVNMTRSNTFEASSDNASPALTFLSLCYINVFMNLLGSSARWRKWIKR